MRKISERSKPVSNERTLIQSRYCRIVLVSEIIGDGKLATFSESYQGYDAKQVLNTVANPPQINWARKCFLQ